MKVMNPENQNIVAGQQPQLGIIDELKNELGKIKDKIKDSSVTKEVFDSLTGTAKILQSKLNELLSKGGIITQSDVNDAYEVIKKTKNEEYEKLKRQSKRKTLLYIGLGLLAGSVIYMIAKKK